jgi:hypothetical protein
MECRSMTAARKLLDAATAAGARFEVCGDRLRVMAQRPLPNELVDDLRRAKAEILRLIPRWLSSDDAGEAASWRDRYAAGIARWSLNGERQWHEAERLAFADLILEWHRRHGSLSDPGRCAGCGDELPDHAGAIIDRDRSRVHFDDVRRIDCIIAYGTRWRGAAVAGLHALGIEPPEGFELL